MTNPERAESAWNLIGGKALKDISNADLGKANFIIYGVYLKKFCMSARMNAHYQILKFIKAHKV